MYTCKETRFLYDMVKDTSEGKNTSAFEFETKFKPIWDELTNKHNPDFGACDDCIDYVTDKKLKIESKKLLKDISD